MDQITAVTDLIGKLLANNLFFLVFIVIILFRPQILVRLFELIARSQNGNGSSNGNGKLQEYINNEQKEFNEKMERHVDIANREMGEVKISLASLDENVKEIKRLIQK